MPIAAVNRTKRAMTFFVAAFCLTASMTARATEVLKCASLEESAAFRLRHLQSRLMVAALGCDQQGAYNSFVEHFKPSLAAAGGRITDYYLRIGGGQAALNGQITEMANAAGLLRARDPNGFCTQAWELFWTLNQDPQALGKIADAHILAMAQPQSCSVTVSAQAGLPPKNVTATFDAAKAAAERSNK